MKHIRILFFVLASTLISSCANDLQGASMYIMQGGYYVERWYLNPEYNRKDIPTGTAFYGDSAEKVKDKFIVKYYIYDDKKSKIGIPKNNMWVINHNGKRSFEQDDENLFFYAKTGLNEYEKFLAGRDKSPLAIGRDRLIPIQSCDEDGWCKVYPSHFYDFEDLYVKQIILKEPLQPEASN